MVKPEDTLLRATALGILYSRAFPLCNCMRAASYETAWGQPKCRKCIAATESEGETTLLACADVADQLNALAWPEP